VDPELDSLGDSEQDLPLEHDCLLCGRRFPNLMKLYGHLHDTCHGKCTSCTALDVMCIPLKVTCCLNCTDDSEKCDRVSNDEVKDVRKNNPRHYIALYDIEAKKMGRKAFARKDWAVGDLKEEKEGSIQHEGRGSSHAGKLGSGGRRSSQRGGSRRVEHLVGRVKTGHGRHHNSS
jgi:hypothetical protein